MKLIEKYISIRKHSESICSPLNIEDYVVQVDNFASPAKWHLAHTTWFFEEFVLKKFIPTYVDYNQKFCYLFNSYYNGIGDRILRSDRGIYSRPTTEEIYEYRAFVDKRMLSFLANNPTEDLYEIITIGLNHEQQHQELLITDIKYAFGNNQLFPVYDKNFNLLKDKNTSSNSLIINEGIYEIGYSGESFCYDNELGVHKVYLNQFEIYDSLVTNGEFIEFINDGGYTDFNLWLDEGWSWIQTNKIHAPLYWYKFEQEWHYYTLSGVKKVEPDNLLCHISFYEASAFAEWKKMRLPTEFEWEIASNQLNWGKRWEWTSSAYLPYPNYKKADGSVGEYNGKFMNNQMVLRGASVATSKNHSRNTYRNFFHSNERWQFTGIRLVK